MRNRVAFLLKIHPGEGGLLGMLAGMMLLVATGSAVGGASIDALFFARFGVSTLPAWFIVMGFVNLLNLLLVTGLVQMIERARLYRSLPLLLAIALGCARLLLTLHLRWFYPVLYIGEGVINALQAVVLWGLAGSLLDTRQAKRLFPLLTSGSIAGAVIGSFATPFLVSWLGAEAMPLVWSLGLFGAWLLSTKLVQRNQGRLASISADSRRNSFGSSRGRLAAIFSEIDSGYNYVRRSPLLRWLSLGNVLFSVLWFSLYLPFSHLSAEQFPDANRLASFFGLFQGAWTSTALLVSLFVTGRLFSRFGIINTLVVYPLIYLTGFVALVMFQAFPTVVISRFSQLSWAQGIADPAWQASLNAVPAERRDQARTFINALPGQAGVILSGLILLIGQQLLRPQQLFMVGAAAAGLCAWTMWRSKEAYRGALSAALSSGQPHVFYPEEEPFRGFQQDPAALDVLLAGLSSSDNSLGRLSAEILGRLHNPKAYQALLDGLYHADPVVRATCLASLRETPASPGQDQETGIARVTALLDDPHPEVRCQAVQTLATQAKNDPHILASLEKMLEDEDASVQTQAARMLIQAGQAMQAMEKLVRLASDADAERRRQAVSVLSECSYIFSAESTLLWQALADGLHDPSPPVRQAALDGLKQPIPADFEPFVVQALGDDDPAVQLSAAVALGRIGTTSLPLVLKALSDPRLESGALQALGYFPKSAAEKELLDYTFRKMGEGMKDYQLGQAFPKVTSERNLLLTDSLRLRGRNQAILALRAYGLLNRQSENEKNSLHSVELVLEGLQSKDPTISAYALETLESGDESHLIRPLIRIWENEPMPGPKQEPGQEYLLKLMEDPDNWLRACAVFSSIDYPNPEIRSRLELIQKNDPDELVRTTAANVLSRGDLMETLATLNTMERILFLRKVPLFADLEPWDLKHIADICVEKFYPDGEIIAHQGDPGDELYIIVSGQVKVDTAERGLLAMRKSGEYVGEMAILDQLPRMATLSTGEDTRLLCIIQKDFKAILHQRPAISLEVIRVLCDRLRHRQT